MYMYMHVYALCTHKCTLYVHAYAYTHVCTHMDTTDLNHALTVLRINPEQFVPRIIYSLCILVWML